MKVYFISDTHFDHENIIEYCGRPFKDKNHMNEMIIQNWNSVVKDNDIVYHLGDFCLGGKDKIKEFANRLNGRKTIILGNHDKYSPSEYMKLGFEWASRFPIIFDKYIILSHEPHFLEINSVHGNFYGHCHQNDYESPQHRHFNVSVEKINYTPIQYEKIRSKLNDK